MATQERKPLAFISTSLRKEDKPFVDLVEEITRENGFEPYGTVGKYSAAPIPIWDHMMENIPKADCVIMAATPRYFQEDIYDRGETKQAISELVYAEGIIATILCKPLLIFCQEDVNLGSLLPQRTQYITLKSSEDAHQQDKRELINSYFINTLEKIKENRSKPQSIATSVRRLPVPASFKGEKALFVGRGDEIDDIKKHLTSSNEPLSIVGMGGIGKSAVCFRAIRESLDYFDNLIDIYFEKGLSFDNLLITLAKRIFVWSEEFKMLDTENRRRLILTELGGLGRLLIIAENYETISEGLISGNPTQDEIKVNTFMEEIPANVAVILTSRHRNNLTGEYIYPLSGLNDADGADLFLKVASIYFVKGVSENMEKLIEKLSNVVGGNPLAIKLLAGGYRGRGSPEIESMISHTRIDATNIMEEEQRHRSLRACFDYSFNGLSKKTKSLLLKFVFFKSPFSTMAAEIIFKSITSNLDELFKRCFIERNNFNEYGEVEEKFWLYYFHPTIRDYLEQKIRKDNIKLPRNQEELFSKFYSTLILEADKGIGKEEYVLLAKTINIIFQSEDNDFRESINLIPEPEQRSHIANNLGLVLLKIHLFKEALYYHEMCLKIDKETRRNDRVATDFTYIGNCFLGLGELDKAQENYCKALGESVNLKDERGIALASGNLATVRLLQDDLDKALEHSNRAVQINIKLNNKEGLSIDYNNIATIFSKRGNYMIALGCFQKALSYDEELHDELGISTDYNNMGIAVKRLGDPDKALEYFNIALEIDKKLDDKRGLLRTYKNIVKALLQKGDSFGAQKYLNEYTAVYAELNKSVTLSDLNNAWQTGQYFHLVTD